MKKGLIIIMMLAIALGLAGSANAALLINGDFDQIDHRDGLVGPDLDDLVGNQWGVYDTIPGWSTTDGSGIEIQRNTVVNAYSGDYYVELDSHPGPESNSAMAQDVYLTKGSYKLSLYYQPRTNNAQSDNGIEVSLAGTILTLDGRTATWEPAGWQLNEMTCYIDADGQYTLQLRAFGLENTLGGFVDSVSLAPIPEPATLFIFGTGLLGFCLKKKF